LSSLELDNIFGNQIWSIKALSKSSLIAIRALGD